MKKRPYNLKKVFLMMVGGALFCFLFLGVLFFPRATWGDMSSSTYQIYADVISIGGGLYTSSTYSMEGTGGEGAVGISSSSTYEIKGGFQYMDLESYVSLTMSSSSLNLGSLSTASVSQASTTAYISTDSGAGYTLSISGVSGTAINSVTDGAVSAGSEEYGLALEGTNRAYTNDMAVLPPRVLSSNIAPITNDQLDLIFKASISPTSTANIYSQTVSLTAAVNF